eukprot:TRINITY_DN2817_c0_g2_i1.p1 TRINITY_DN2817_c0_g2~~TRINITY_DN2817_c0_g2_i1.p1  ORF type:complete len:557 (+),score=123.32 TRINITY_DN2817_c0_g2_i1:212-1882(+)
MSIPFLPGFSAPDNRTTFYKSQTISNPNAALKYASGKVEEEIALPSLSSPFGQRSIKKSGPSAPFVPAHVTFDKKVLNFTAFWTEDVEKGKSRVRQGNLYFFLEDSTIQVREPKVANAGVLQGVIISRQIIPKQDELSPPLQINTNLPPPKGARSGVTYYGAEDLYVGADVNFYGRRMHIVDCDHFTREFYKNQFDVDLAHSEPIPLDPHTEQRKLIDKPLRTTQPPSPDKAKLKKFLERDGKVLRFFCVWNNSDDLYGEKRKFILHYYLVDDSVEVREEQEPNSGRGTWSVFMKKQKLPKKFTGIASIHAHTKPEEDFYTDADFKIGETINVFGRKITIKDCDPYTQEFYRTKYGIEMVADSSVQEQPESSSVEHTIPPHSGFGSEEDSLSTCLSLVPKAPKKDFHKMAENDKKILRFTAILANGKPLDQDRRFVVSFYLADNTVGVFENGGRNTGIPSGKFFERRKVKHPERVNAQAPGRDHKDIDAQYYAQSDFYVGATIEISNHRFTLTEADEFALKYMEANPSEFPSADFDITINKLKELMSKNVSTSRQP